MGKNAVALLLLGVERGGRAKRVELDGVRATAELWDGERGRGQQ